MKKKHKLPSFNVMPDTLMMFFTPKSDARAMISGALHVSPSSRERMSAMSQGSSSSPRPVLKWL